MVWEFSWAINDGYKDCLSTTEIRSESEDRYIIEHMTDINPLLSFYPYVVYGGNIIASLCGIYLIA